MVYFDFYSRGTTLRPHKRSLIWALMPKGEKSPTSILQVKCCVKQGSPDQIFTRKTCFMILNKKKCGHSLILHVDCIRLTQHFSMWGWGDRKKCWDRFFFLFWFFFVFSFKNQRLVLVCLWKGLESICWEGQVVISKTLTAGSIMGISYLILRRQASIWAKVGMGQWSWSEVGSRVKKGDSIYMNWKTYFWCPSGLFRLLFPRYFSKTA